MSKQKRFCQVLHKFAEPKNRFFLTFCASILRLFGVFLRRKLRFKCPSKSNFAKFFTLSPSEQMFFSNFLHVNFAAFWRFFPVKNCVLNVQKKRFCQVFHTFRRAKKQIFLIFCSSILRLFGRFFR